MEKEPSAWEYNWATLILGGTNMGTWYLRLGVSKEILDYGHEFCGTWVWEWLREYLIIRNPQLSKYNFNGRENKNWLHVPDGGPTPGQMSRLNVGRNIRRMPSSGMLCHVGLVRTDVPLKRQFSQEPYGVTFQKMAFFIVKFYTVIR
jgi:hypothetical protein